MRGFSRLINKLYVLSNNTLLQKKSAVHIFAKIIFMPMNLRLLSLAIFTIALSAFADVISPEQALTRVMGTQHQPMSANTSSTPKLVKTEIASGLPTVYVYSKDDSSFMILSADDQAEAMLAYGDNFTGEINPSMQWLLGEYSKEIESLRNNPLPRKLTLTTTATTKATNTDKAPISPMLTTKWDQSAPYNNKCPLDGGVRSVSGCVATAMAQVINYHRVPTGNGYGIASYQWNGQTLTYDFANNSFDWDNMLDVYTSSATAAQNNAVAELMYACGVSVKMGYSAYGSGAYSEDVPNAMIKYFGFDKNVHSENRAFYTSQGWNDFIYSQLIEYGPVMLSGDNSTVGHMFVCDGYSSDDFFHINWGWSGVSDGYFKLSALDPSTQGIGGSTSGYNANLNAIANVKAPSEDSDYYKEMCLDSRFEPSETSAPLGGFVVLKGWFYNAGAVAMNCSIGFILENVTTHESTVLPHYEVTNLGVGYGAEALDFNIPTTLNEGTYYLYPAWKTDGIEWTKMRVRSNYANYIVMTVSDSQAHFSVDNGAEIDMKNIELQIPIITGYESVITGEIQNTSNYDYYGPIFAALLTTTNQTHIASAYPNNIDVRAGESINVTYKSTFRTLNGSQLTPGEYYLVFANQEGYIISSDIIIVEVVEAPTQMGYLTVPSIEFVGDSNNADKNNLEFQATINSIDGPFIGTLNLWIFEVYGLNSFSLVDMLSSKTIYVGDGEPAVHTFKGAMPSLTDGGRYCGVLYQSSSQVSDVAFFTVGATSAIEDIATDNQVESREYYTISGVKVAEENLEPGLYIVVEKMSNGEIVTTKKMVR